MAGWLELPKTPRASRAVSELMGQLMNGIRERAGEEAAVRAQLLLDYVDASIPQEGLTDPELFRGYLVEQAKVFVQCSGGDPEARLRMMGASHVLVNMLQLLLEGSDDEYIAADFEELRDGLNDLERIDLSNPSLNARLSSIFDGLIELCTALGIVTPPAPAKAQQKV